MNLQPESNNNKSSISPVMLVVIISSLVIVISIAVVGIVLYKASDRTPAYLQQPVVVQTQPQFKSYYDFHGRVGAGNINLHLNFPSRSGYSTFGYGNLTISITEAYQSGDLYYVRLEERNPNTTYIDNGIFGSNICSRYSGTINRYGVFKGTCTNFKGTTYEFVLTE